MLIRVNNFEAFDDVGPWCRWSQRDGCRCCVNPHKPTDALISDVKVAIESVVDAMNTVCNRVPLVVEQLEELRRRILTLPEDGRFPKLRAWIRGATRS